MDLTFDCFLPQGEAVSAIPDQIQEGTLVHALMITGEAGVGKKTLARLIASSLLCSGNGKRPCGICESCRLTAAGEHPDLILIQRGSPLSANVKKERTTIPVDDIREMIRLSSVHPSIGDRRVIMIFDADKMTGNAQNALLKIVEEPPAETWFLIVCERKDQLLPTIVSRCQPLRLSPWKDSYVEEILLERGVDASRAARSARASHGSIGKALQIAGDEEYWQFREDVLKSFFFCENRSSVLPISSKWKDRKSEAEMLFGILEDLVELLLRLHLSGKSSMENPPETLFPEKWIRFADLCDLSAFPLLFDGIKTARNQAAASVNFQTVVEQILFMLMEARDKWSM